MKPFENWNPKSLVLAGAALGASVLLLLAAVPSQTDFDGTYFKTNSLPISLTGFLTNWAKLDTNASGGDTIWTTNADGVISPLGTGQLTNVLGFTSGLANNVTNVAIIVDTANYWPPNSGVHSPVLGAFRSAGTNQLQVASDGGLTIGQYTQAHFNQLAGDYGESLLSYRDVDAEGLNYNEVIVSVGHGTDGGNHQSSSVIEVFDEGADIHADTITSSGSMVLTAGIGTKTNSLFIRLRTNSVELTQMYPLRSSTNTPYRLDTGVTHTSSNLLEVANTITNQFTVGYDGSITTGGNTNRWIFGGATNGAPDVSVDGTHYPLAVTDSPALTGTPTINGQSVETQLTNKVAKAGDTMTGNLSSPNFIIPPTALASGDLTNIVVDFALAGLRTCVLSTNTVISAQNFSAGASVAIRLTNSSASIITLTFTNTWPTPLGSGAPSQMLPGKVGVLAVTSWGTTEPEFTWTYAVQP